MALTSGFSTALILLDFSAAFDCVDHSILLKVLQLQFGVTASALQWISSFLASRSHCDTLSGSSSKIFSVPFGVPQGSILGPLLFILYTSNVVKIASQHGLMIHLNADDTQLYIKLCCYNLENTKMKMTACGHHIQSWCAFMRLKIELIWFDRRSTLDDDNSTKNLNLDPQCSIPPSDVIRDLGVLLDCRLNMTQHVSCTARTSQNLTSETLSWLNMPLYSCSSSCHLPTQLLQLCPLRSAFIHTTTLILGSTHCSSSNKRSQSQRPYHTYTETTALASHPCSNRIQNLPPHVSHPFPNLSIIHVIHGYAMLCFQVQRTPIIHTWGFWRVMSIRGMYKVITC